MGIEIVAGRPGRRELIRIERPSGPRGQLLDRGAVIGRERHAGRGGHRRDYLGTTVSEQIVGRPTPSLSTTLRQWADPGAPVLALPEYIAGFTRSSAA